MLTDSCSKALAIHKARKCCKLRAIEHAFSKVLLIVLHNGKVTVEINTSKPDMLTDMQVEKMADEQVLRVCFIFWLTCLRLLCIRIL